MLFLSVRGFLDYAGPSDRSRLSRISRCAFLHQEGVGVLVCVFRSSIARPTDTPVYASSDISRCLPQD